MNTKIFAGIFSFIILIVVIELVRREQLTCKYAVGWIMISIAAILLVIFDYVLADAAHWFGFELTSNFIFFTLLCCFVFLSLLLTTFLCQQDVRNDTIAQKIGILEMELSQLKEQQEKNHNQD